MTYLESQSMQRGNGCDPTWRRSLPAKSSVQQRLPITLPELVDTSPSLTDDGSIITGERRTRVFALDRRTGSLLHVFSDREAEVAAAASAGGAGAGGSLAEAPDPLLRPPGPFGMGGIPVLQMLDPDRILLVGRQDFLVRSKQVSNWGGGNWEGWEGGVLPLFTVGADHTLQAYDPASRLRRWALRFKTPPVGVFAEEHGDTNFLDPATVHPLLDLDPEPPAAAGAPTDARRRRHHHHRGGGSGGGGSDSTGGGGDAADGARNLVLVGELKGSLYAMPAERVVLDERVEVVVAPWDAIALPGPGSDYHSIKPLPLLPSTADAAVAPAVVPAAAEKAVVVHSGGASSKDLVAYARDAETGEGVVSGLACRPPGLQILATVGEPTGVRQPWLPDAPKPGGGLRLPAAGNSSGGSGAGAAAATGAFVLGVEAGSGMLTVVLLATAGVGAAAVLVVLQFRGGKTAAAGLNGKGSAASAAIDVAAAAAAAAVAGGAAAGEANIPAAAAAAMKSGGGGGPGGSRGAGSGRGRRKGRGGEGGSSSSGGGGGGDGSSFRSSDTHLSSIPENQQLPSGTEGPPSPSARPTFSPSPRGPPGAVAAPHLPSAEPRVRLRGDGSLAIGRLVVGPGILGYGSAGTVVYEGVLDGRPVAVKRLLRQFTELARKEIEVLILSDEHPNVVRCFALEEDREFVYLALEKCRCLSTLLDVCRGLAALHERGIVHRDLKPHNVLLTESGQRAKLSDMGLSKQLVPEQSSFESHHGPGGSSGWQAPEQLIARDGGAARQTRSMDVFSLGCILYYCMTGGRHPFGDNHYERDARILRADPVLGPLCTAGPEAFNLVSSCLAREPASRPAVGAVLGHPLWVENEDREPDTSLLAAMESYAAVALAGPGMEALEGAGIFASSSSSPPSSNTPGLTAALTAALAASCLPNWGASLPPELVGNLGRYRRYDFTSLRDLLRVVRNKRNHFREMPPALQSMLGPLPGGFLRFFCGRFPHLLLAVYVFAVRHLANEPTLQQYWGDGGGGEGAEPFVRTFMAMYGNRMKPTKTQQQPQQQQQQQSPAGGASTQGLVSEPQAAQAVVGAATIVITATATATGTGGGEEAKIPVAPPPTAVAATSSSSVSSSAAVPVGSGSCSGPPGPAGGRSSSGSGDPQLPAFPPPPPQPPPPLVLVGYEPSGDDGAVMVREFPRRPGKQLCDFYVKTGHCKFGESCVFDHPELYAVRLTALGLPLRPEEQICTFYLKNNECRFGPACKFHHPPLRPVYAGSLAVGVAEGAGGGAAVSNDSIHYNVVFDGVSVHRPPERGTGFA
ncbi:hypothetical protein VOLCADRAFT_107956 [Volvox carteri f. nagariensis]|uniref:non-specific serine/threonine protein kinase n=1 Tax=Volvox carteri f. nagariensis TaxID=3068 RepID=D8UHE6_VOLCA|nr:uncharacterized protein VOLCADRAFT_107956 [Volvox carteri f. nagariensis]EFJ40840.1 hypothetical protein VOLCADRAFT_107956 [Volvox carteri f. nagariensis]|eukprot:XP_002958109.1 hypothetical protein VOLCADRAFT_107956 [Volvox carteri f. nagariensis]